ncbi:MAG TPA: tetratricopeptide repeat protein, partial [Chloroflexia bacterium]|nr:tetratricopeptide repeat protein [Chloroflexia bacterium]
TLDACLAAAAAGHGQIAAITAEAGLGKSRLVAEVRRRAHAAGFVSYEGEGQATGTATPYLAWTPIWRAFFDLDPAADPAAQAARLERALAALDPALVPRLPLLGRVLGLPLADNALTSSFDPGLRKASLEALLLDCLRAWAAAPTPDTGVVRPLLLVLEDCHWLDPLSADLLEGLGRALECLPVGIVLAFRPPGDHAALHRLRSLPYYTAIPLTTFTPAEAEQLITLKLTPADPAARAVPPALMARLAERAEGNPFYLEELVNYLQDQGLDLHDPAAWPDQALPASLQSLILSRMDALTAPQQTTLKVASVIGRWFPYRWLWAVYPELGEDSRVRADLDVLSRLDLTPLDTPDPELSYLFKHIMTQEVAYASLPYSLRAQLHERLAHWIESTGQPLLDLLAYHYSQSANQAKQIEYYERAGDAAAAAYANATARDYYERLLARYPPDAPAGPPAAVLLKLVAVLQPLGELTRATAHAEAAIHLADQAGDPLQLAHAQGQLGRVLLGQSKYAAALEALEQAAAGFRALDTPPAARGLTAILAEIATVYIRRSDLTRAELLLQESLAQAQAHGDARGIAAALRGLGTVSGHQGDFGQWRARLEESVARYQALGDRPGYAQALNGLGCAVRDQGDLAGASALFQELLALGQELGDRVSAAMALHNLGDVTYLTGDYAQGQAYFTEALALNREMGRGHFIAECRWHLGRIAWEQGQRAAACAHLEASLTGFRDLGEPGWVVWALLSLGWAVWAPDAGAATRAYFDEALAISETLGDFQHQETMRFYLGVLDCAEGAYAAARARLETCIARWQGRGDPGARAMAFCVLGIVAGAQGDPAAAATCWRQSLAQFPASTDVTWRRTMILCWLGLAGVLAGPRAGRLAGAAAHWRAAPGLQLNPLQESFYARLAAAIPPPADPAAWAAAVAAGQALAWDTALAEALAE